MFKYLFLVLAAFIFACRSDNPSKNITEGLLKDLVFSDVMAKVKSDFSSYEEKIDGLLMVHGAGQVNDYLMNGSSHDLVDMLTGKPDIAYFCTLLFQDRI